MVMIDIEMPPKCGLCPCFHAEYPMYCQAVKADRNKMIVQPYGQPRPNWCPLAEKADMWEDEENISEKGTWRHYEGEITCSECGSSYYDEIMDLCDSDVPKFCPNCGAEMRETYDERRSN